MSVTFLLRSSRLSSHLTRGVSPERVDSPRGSEEDSGPRRGSLRLCAACYGLQATPVSKVKQNLPTARHSSIGTPITRVRNESSSFRASLRLITEPKFSVSARFARLRSAYYAWPTCFVNGRFSCRPLPLPSRLKWVEIEKTSMELVFRLQLVIILFPLQDNPQSLRNATE